MNPNAIKGLFNLKKQSLKKEWEEHKLDRTLQAISQIVKDLQTAGLPIRIEIFAVPGEKSFNLFHSGPKTVPVSGRFMIGNAPYLFALRYIDEPETCQMAISRFHIDQEKNGDNIRSETLIFNDSFEIQLTTYLVTRCARHALMMEYDTKNTFNTPLYPRTKNVRPLELKK